MPKDKRLVICKAILDQVKKAAAAKAAKGGASSSSTTATQQQLSSSAAAAEAMPMTLTFVLPAKALPQDDLFRTKRFQLPHPTFVQNGRHTAVIVPEALVHDVRKVNNRHKFCDAVVPAEAICAPGADAAKRAVQVAGAFARFVVDERVAKVLPASITAAVSKGGKEMCVMKQAEPGQELVLELSLACRGAPVTIASSGACTVRIGHGNMTAGELCENAKAFIATVRASFPHVYKPIAEFKLVSPVTEPIRLVEAHILRS
mmetsp:Transcript_35161/g.108541  ORF Transcript_35161/g.108541 Transcript_35161/m.108541 type:complete len:260 (-) Transcript_35161:71-850(-)